MSLNKYFKETMDYLGVRGSALAEAAGCSRNNISEIRNGKANPPISRFWELVEICEGIVPGFKQEFSKRLGGISSPDIDYDQMNEDELAECMIRIGQAWKHRQSRKNADEKRLLSVR